MNTTILQKPVGREFYSHMSPQQKSLIKAGKLKYLVVTLGFFFHISHCISIAVVYLFKMDNHTESSGWKMTALAICELHRKDSNQSTLKNLHHLGA